MKQFIILLVVFFNCSYLPAQWKPAGERIKTEWATKIDVENVLPEYPRPIMERPNWVNLNGLWNYAITSVGQAAPQKYEGQILVPFAIESSLSGVGKRLGKENDLWYQRKFSVPSKWKGERVLLHFGAVDWKTDIWVNQIKIGQHCEVGFGYVSKLSYKRKRENRNGRFGNTRARAACGRRIESFHRHRAKSRYLLFGKARRKPVDGV